MLCSRSMWWLRGVYCWRGCSIRSWWAFISPSKLQTCFILSWTTLMEGRCVLQSLEWSHKPYKSYVCVSGLYPKVGINVCDPASVMFSALLPPPEGRLLSWAQGCVLCSRDGSGTGVPALPLHCLQVPIPFKISPAPQLTITSISQELYYWVLGFFSDVKHLFCLNVCLSETSNQRTSCWTARVTWCWLTLDSVKKGWL